MKKLTDLRKFDYFENYIQDIYNVSEKKLRKIEREHSKNKNESNSLNNEIKNKQEGLNINKSKLNEREIKLDKVKAQIKDLNTKIGEAKIQHNIHEKLGRINTLIEIVSDNNFGQIFLTDTNYERTLKLVDKISEDSKLVCLEN